MFGGASLFVMAVNAALAKFDGPPPWLYIGTSLVLVGLAVWYSLAWRNPIAVLCISPIAGVGLIFANAELSWCLWEDPTASARDQYRLVGASLMVGLILLPSIAIGSISAASFRLVQWGKVRRSGRRAS